MKDAVDRAMELMRVPQGKLPPLALALRNRMALRLGLCMEVSLTAFAVYAQVVENLPCSDPLYAEGGQLEVIWLREQLAAKGTQ